MFYTATDLAGVLWETALRYVEPDDDRNVRIDPMKLTDMRAVELELVHDRVPVLELGQPGLRAIFPTVGCAEAVAVAALIAEPDHFKTHPESRQLQQELASVGITEMPVLAWPSRQHSATTVYLAFQPPMQSAWWSVVSDPIGLDDPSTGHSLLRDTLRESGYYWTPLATTATPPGVR